MEPIISITAEMYTAIFLAVALIIVFFVAAMFVGRIRYGLRLMPAVFGLLAYLLVGYLLENFLLETAFNALIGISPDFYMLAAGLIAGVLEMGAALIVFKFLPRQTTEMAGYYSFALGFSVLRAVMFAVLPLMESLKACLSVSVYGWGEHIKGMEADAVSKLEEAMLFNMEHPWDVFMLPAAQVCLTGLLSLSMMLIVWLSQQKSGRTNLFMIAALITAIANCSLALRNIGVLDALAATVALAVVTALAAVLMVVFNRRYNMLQYPGRKMIEGD